tara:strand:- start:515 stop:1324 length:810 start_codon:yes stop_codon:yes gene_type:complete
MEINQLGEFEIKKLKNRIGKTGVFELSTVTVFKTKEYDLFSLMKGNRKVDQKRVDKIVAEMQQNDLHPHRPIIVDDDLKILEGQHTFFSRKKLDRDVYFTIAMSQTTEKIAGFNNSVKAWNNEDYLQAFISDRKLSYVKFKEWIDKNKLPIAVGLCFMGTQGASGTKSGGAFKKGKLIFLPEEETQTALNLYKGIARYNNESQRKGHIARACSIVTNAAGYDEDRMFEKLEHQKDKIDAHLNTMDCIRQLEEFYNHGFSIGSGNYLRLL